MFRYSLTSSIGEIKAQESISSEEEHLLFYPSNNIIQLQTSPVITDDILTLKQWGYNQDPTQESSDVIYTISFEDALSNPNFQHCLIPLNGYFVSFQFIGKPCCLYQEKDNESLIFAAGILCPNDSFLFVTSEQFIPKIEENDGIISLPYVLSDATKISWLNNEFDLNNPSQILNSRRVSILSLGNSLYNGKRCTEEYTPFELHTKASLLAKDMLYKAFSKNRNWFDEF